MTAGPKSTSSGLHIGDRLRLVWQDLSRYYGAAPIPATSDQYLTHRLVIRFPARSSVEMKTSSRSAMTILEWVSLTQPLDSDTRTTRKGEQHPDDADAWYNWELITTRWVSGVPWKIPWLATNTWLTCQ